MKTYQKLLRQLAKKYLINTEDTTLQEMRGESYTHIVVPWEGKPVMVMVRTLNEVRLRACGAFGIFDFFRKRQDDGKEDTTLSDTDLGEVLDIQERVMKASLYSPTYEEILDSVYGEDQQLKNLKEEADKLEQRILKASQGSPEDRLGLRDAQKRLKNLKMATGFLVPADFAAAITSWAIGKDRTDINLVTKSMLVQAGFLSQKSKERPSEFIKGVFTDFQKTEIDSAAVTAWMEYEREARELAEAKRNGQVVHTFNRPKE